MKVTTHIDSSVMVSFRCSIHLKEQAASAAKSLRIPFSDFVRRALELFLIPVQRPELCAQPCNELHHVLRSVLEEGEPAVEAGVPTIALLCREEAPIVRSASEHHHIAFFNQKEHQYQGFRVSICRQKNTLQRYFSASTYGNAATALTAAIAVRDHTLEQLKQANGDPERIKAIIEHAKTMPIPWREAER